MSSIISVSPLPSWNPDPDTAKDHHVGSPPTHFRNPWPSYKDHSSLEVLKLRFGNSPEKTNTPVPEGPNGSRSDQLVHILEPDWGREHKDRLRATWIGHASWLVQTPAIDGAVRGIRVLFDPGFSERTSPFSFFGPKRYTPTPCSLYALPDVDIVCISHNHYDHLDIATLTPLYQRLHGRIHFLVPLGLKRWFIQNLAAADKDVTELDWWDRRELVVPGHGAVQFTCCPAQHSSRRTIWDTDSTLWCSWALETRSEQPKRLFFAGDTAYRAHEAPSACPAFAQIGRMLGPFDLAMIPIGLYSPERFAACFHIHPEQALDIHKDVRSRLSLGMHYGTVRGGLSGVFEDVRDPPRRWRVAAEKDDMWCGGGIEGEGTPVDVTREGVGLCHIGETVAV